MVYKRQIPLKIDGKYVNPPSEYEVKRRKIKHLQRYQKKIKTANIEDLPKLAFDLYSYLIKKSILLDNEYIRQELNAQLINIISSYKFDYSPLKQQEIIDGILKLADSSVVDCAIGEFHMSNGERHIPGKQKKIEISDKARECIIKNLAIKIVNFN